MSRTKFFNTKQAIFPVIATILLTTITVIIGVGTFQFLSIYTQDQLLTTEDNLIFDDSNIRIVDVDSQRVLFQTNRDNFTIFRTSLDGVECSSEEETLSGRPLRVNISSCSSQITTSRPRLIIETDRGIIQRDLRSQDLGVSVGGSQSGEESVSSVSPFFNECTLRDNKSGCEIHYIPITIDNGLGGEIDVVHDTILGLYWQRNGIGYLDFNGDELTWEQARDYCFSLGTDWRLPTLIEMELSIWDAGMVQPYIIGGSGVGSLFNNIQNAWYWTDTKRNSSDAFVVDFDNDLTLSFSTDTNHRVLCLKEAPDFNEIWGATQTFSFEGGIGQERIDAQFEVDDPICGGAGTMYDTITDLCWERNPSISTFTHDNAIIRCNSLSTAGGEWRLPEKVELITLLFHNGDSQTAGRLNNIGFSDIQDSWYWSNTKIGLDPMYTMTYSLGVNFNVGISDSLVPSSSYVLCVKTAS